MSGQPRFGFTTGSCAAAAAKAAAFMLLSGKVKTEISIMTPKGIEFKAEILDIKRSPDSVSCGVMKDGGDDPDVTTGLIVCACVSFGSLADPGLTVTIDGGRGVGRVTKPGLDQPVGNAAINFVPRSMIEKEVAEVANLLDYHGAIDVVIYVPGGDEKAEKTFNPRLGIVGGISILGTSGIVEPMSTQALIDTIRIELSQQRAMGYSKVVIAPGNYGLDFMKARYGYDLDRAVKCSNYIGITIDMAAEMGFTDLLLCGHMGKLIKLTGGIMNTHSREADSRMELMAAAVIRCGGDMDLLNAVLRSLTTDEAYQYIKAKELGKPFMDCCMEQIGFYLKRRAGDRLNIECIMYSKENADPGTTKGAEALLKEIMETGTFQDDTAGSRNTGESEYG